MPLAAVSEPLRRLTVTRCALAGRPDTFKNCFAPGANDTCNLPRPGSPLRCRQPAEVNLAGIERRAPAAWQLDDEATLAVDATGDASAARP